MSQLRIYNQYGSQIEPNIARPQKADQKISKLIDESVACWIDTGQSRIFSKVRAQYFGDNGTRRDQFGAVFDSGNIDSLLSDFANALQELEKSDDWANFVKSSDNEEDQGYYFPWLLQSVRGQSLQELGLGKGHKFTITKLLEEGEQLTLGVEDYETAAIALSSFAQEATGHAEVAISESGRIPAIESANLVLKPSADVNFEAVDESTEQKLRTRFQNLERDLVQEFKSDVRAARTSLLNLWDNEFWKTYHELQRIETSIERTLGTREYRKNLQTEAGNRIVELVRAIDRGQEVDNSYDLGLLSDHSVQEEINWVRDWLEMERREIKESAPQRAKECFENILDSADTRDRHRAYELVKCMLERVGHAETTHQADDAVLDDFNSFYKWVDSGDILSTGEAQNLRRTIRTKLIKQKNKYEDDEREEIETRFENAIEALGHGNTHEAKVYKEAKISLQTDEETETSVINTQSQFSRAVRRLNNNEVLSLEKQEEIRSDILDKLENKREDAVKKRRQYWKQRFDSKLDRIQDDSNFIEQFETLCAIKQRLESNQSTSEENDSVSGLKHFLDQFEEDDILDRTGTWRVHRSFVKKTNEAIDTTREKIRDDLTRKVDRQVKNIPADGESIDSAISDLETLQQRTRLGGDQQYSDDVWVEKINENITLVRSGSCKGVPYFDKSTSIAAEDVLEAFRQSINSRLTELRSDKRSNLIGKFKRLLKSLKRASNFDSATLVSLIKKFRNELGDQKLETGQLGTEIDIEETHITETRDELLELIDIANFENDDGVLTASDANKLNDQFSSILDTNYNEAQNNLQYVVEKELKKELRQHYDLKVNPQDDISSLIERKNNFEEIREIFEDIEQRRFYNIRETELSKKTVDVFKLLEDDRKISVADSVLTWASDNELEIRNIISEKVRKKFLNTFDTIDSGCDYPEQKIEAYTVLRAKLNDKDSKTTTNVQAVSEVLSLSSHLLEDDRKTVMEQLEDLHQSAVDKFETSLLNELKEELDEIESTADNPYVAFESLENNLGEGDDRVHTIANHVSDLRDQGVLDDSKAEKIRGKIKDDISKRKSNFDPPTAPLLLPSRDFGLGERSIFPIIFVVSFLGVGLLISGLLIAPIGDQGGSTDSFISSLQVQQQGQSITVDGTVPQSSGNLVLLVDGPESIDQKIVPVSAGRFETSITGVVPGQYQISLRPEGDQTAWMNLSTEITSSQPPYSISRLSVQPACSENHSLRISGEASDTLRSVEISTLTSGVTTQQEVRVENGTFELGINEGPNGTDEIAVKPTTSPANWTNLSTSQTRLVEQPTC